MHATIAVKTLNLAICTELLSVTELEACSGKCVKLRPNLNLQHSAGGEGDRVTPLCGQEAISRVSNAAPALLDFGADGSGWWHKGGAKHRFNVQPIPDMEAYVVCNAQWRMHPE